MNEQREFAKLPRPAQKLSCARDVCRDPARNATSREQPGCNTRDMSAFSFTLTLLVLGTIAAARTDHPVFWLLFGPTPFAAGYAALIFIRQGFGRQVFLLTFWQAGRSKQRPIVRLVARLSPSEQVNVPRRFEKLSTGIALAILAFGFVCLG
jgi:hypothetical protein